MDATNASDEPNGVDEATRGNAQSIFAEQAEACTDRRSSRAPRLRNDSDIVEEPTAVENEIQQCTPQDGDMDKSGGRDAECVVDDHEVAQDDTASDASIHATDSANPSPDSIAARSPESALTVMTSRSTVSSDAQAIAQDTQSPKELNFHDELSGIRAALTFHQNDDEGSSRLVEGIRSWTAIASGSHRGRAHSSGGDRHALRLIGLAPPCSTSALPQPEATDDAEMHGCLAFDDGVYRGQVKSRDAIPNEQHNDGELHRIERVPDGWGILTSKDGLRRVGRWRDGEQVECGSLQSAVFTYDGEWQAGAGPTGYGIGSFAFGVVFTGRWHNGRPYGLGRMQSVEPSGTQQGWFYGLTCVQRVEEDQDDIKDRQCVQSHLPPRRCTEQPERGLFLMGEILEANRLAVFRHVLRLWRQYSCDQVIEFAREARADALVAWREAHIAEEKAISYHLNQEVSRSEEEMAEILEEVSAGRARYKKLQKLREFHANKLATAVFQRDLARRCVDAQNDSIVLMKKELAEVTTLIEEAKRAQADCQISSQRLHHAKRQVENVSVKINTLKEQLRQRGQAQENRESAEEAARLALRTPATPSHAKALQRPKQPSKLQVDDSHPYVCDIPGCTCGISRDVFLRVGSALNGD